MKVYKAETGQSINWHSTAKIIQNVEDLKEEIEKDTGVPIQNQILMTDFGKLVKDDNLSQILQSTGKDEYIVFCYDRSYLNASEDNIEALIDAETPILEPDLPSFNGSLIFTQFKNTLKRDMSLNEICNAYLSLFVKFESYNQAIIRSATAHVKLSRWLVKEQKMQGMALQVALTSLDSHTRLSEACIQLFVTKAEKEYYRQQSLLNTLNDDLTILNNVKIHSTISKILDPMHQQKKYLLDFVDQQHVQTVRQETLTLCDYLSNHIKALKLEMSELKSEEDKFQEQVHVSSNLQALDDTLADIQTLEQQIQTRRARTKRDFSRVCEKLAALLDKPVSSLLDSSLLSDSTMSMASSTTSLRKATKDGLRSSDKKKALESMTHLAEFHVTDYLPKLCQCEFMIREKTAELILSKRKAIKTFLTNMAVVSKFQQHVGRIQPNVNQHMQYLNDFKLKYNGQDLESLRHILFAYGAIMIELVRRKEYTNLLVSNVGLMADILSQYRSDEEARRDHFSRVISKSFPFKPMMPEKPPQCDISMTETDQMIDLKKHDIAEFISLITQVYSNSPQLIHSKDMYEPSRQSNSKFISRTFQDDEKFLNLLRDMVNDMDSMQDHFMSAIKKEFFDDTVEQRFSQICITQNDSYSVMEDKKTRADNKVLKGKLALAEQRVNGLEQKNKEQKDEITKLQDMIKNLEKRNKELESQQTNFLKVLENKDQTTENLKHELEQEVQKRERIELEYSQDLERLRQERNEGHDNERVIMEQNYKEQVDQLNNLIKEKDQVLDEIKALQQQTKNMAKKVQEDWTTKNSELKLVKQEKEAIEVAVRDLLQRFRPNDPELTQLSLDVYITSFKENLEEFEQEYDMTKNQLKTMTKELTKVTEEYTSLIDIHSEWRTVASRMADKLEEFRKHVVFDIVNQLQLSMDEDVLNSLQKKITQSDDDTAVWNEILHLSSAIDPQKFVVSVHKRVKDTYEQAKQYKKEYRSIKEKYNKHCNVYCDKIAFRNFKVGDVALFLPTKSPVGKPWAAFNINAPHYFLNQKDSFTAVLQKREWVVARIVKITEHVADANQAETNPFGLTHGIKYHVMEIEHWRQSRRRAEFESVGPFSMTQRPPVTLNNSLFGNAGPSFTNFVNNNNNNNI